MGVNRFLKIRSVSHVATLLGGGMGVLCFGWGVLHSWLFWPNDIFSFWGFHVVWGVLCFCLGVLCYFLSRVLVRQYVLYRIKPIYQIIGQRDSSLVELDSLYKGSDVAIQVRSELQTWADSNKVEIERLKENEQYRKEFVGNVSHELKTPIFSIQGYVLTLLDGGLEDPHINRKYLLKTEQNIDRLINIVEDLEQISKLETNSLILNIEPFDFVALADELVESIEMQAASRMIRVSVECDRVVMVRADRARISQVLINLLSNSIKYGRQSGSTRVNVIDMFDRVMIEVQDDGVGIPREMLPRIFERFFRVDKSRSREQGGTGLGLAIAKHIIEAHRQTITVRSVAGQGSTFSFTLLKN